MHQGFKLVTAVHARKWGCVRGVREFVTGVHAGGLRRGAA